MEVAEQPDPLGNSRGPHASHSVFISHDTIDSELAGEFSELLSNASAGVVRGFQSSSVHPSDGIPYGSDWYRVILEELRKADSLVAVLTPNSFHKPWLLYEAGIAEGLGKPVIGLVLGMSKDTLVNSPFHRFQMSTIDESSLAKLVLELLTKAGLSPSNKSIAPHLHVFDQDIAKRLKERPLPPVAVRRRHDVRTLHYVSPVEPASDFFNRFYGRLSTLLSMREELDLQFHSTAEDPCRTVAELLGRIPESDAIMVIPKTLYEMRGSIEGLHHALERHPRKRLVFVDRTPPRDLVAQHENTSFVGINNRRVGILAGFALFRRLSQFGGERVYVVVDGPGGPERSRGVLDAIAALDPGVKVEKLTIKDLPGNDTRDKIKLEAQRLRQRYPGERIGVFAGNDETGRAICHEILRSQVTKEQASVQCVVGCDATREMREWVDTWPDIATATIYNRLYSEDSINAILRAMSERVLLPIDPELYPGFVHDVAERDERVKPLWDKAEWVL